MMLGHEQNLRASDDTGIRQYFLKVFESFSGFLFLNSLNDFPDGWKYTIPLIVCGS